MPNLRSRVKLESVRGEISPRGPAAKQSPVKTQVAKPEDQCRQSPSQPHLEATRVSRRESPMQSESTDGCLTDPEPGMDRGSDPLSAMCVQNVDVRVSCSSHSDAQLAAFFIDPRAK